MNWTWQQPHPVIGHCGNDLAFSNSRALQDLIRMRPELAGCFERDDTGRLTGRALGPGIIRRLKQLLPLPDPPARRDAIRRAMTRMLACGVTSVLDPGQAGEFSEDLAAYQSVLGENRLPVRVTLMFRPHVGESPDTVREVLQAGRLRGECLATDYLKLFADGEVQDALMSEDYPGRPGYRGHALLSEDELADNVALALEHGWRVCTHAAGDEAVAVTLRAYERGVAMSGRRPDPGTLGIAHAFILGPEHIATISRLGAVMFMQPHLSWAFGDEMIEAWGRDRAARAGPVRTLINHGILPAGGSDIYPPDSGVGLFAAVTRATIGGDVLEAERLSRMQALQMYTTWAADAMGRGQELGSITPGKLCDLAVFPVDPVACSPEQLRSLTATAVVVGGRLVRSEG